MQATPSALALLRAQTQREADDAERALERVLKQDPRSADVGVRHERFRRCIEELRDIDRAAAVRQGVRVPG